MSLPTSLENQSLYHVSTSKYTTGTVSRLSRIDPLLFGVTNDGTHEFTVVGDMPECNGEGHLISARWAIVEGSKREV